MAKKGSCTNVLMRIDLTNRNISEEEISNDVRSKFLGGKGLGAYYLFQELSTKINPLSEENKIIFMTGPLTGTLAPTPNRFSIISKSPLTGTWCDSNCGGFWGPELKFSGFDGIVIEGKATKPCYINIRNEHIELLDAKSIWGCDTFSTERILKEKHCINRMPRTISIGPAGEKTLRLAAITSEGRASGRGGLGAVMGSKNLKALVVTGNKYSPEDFVFNKEDFKRNVKIAYKNLFSGKITNLKNGRLSIYGTAHLMKLINSSGGLATKNFQVGEFEYAKELQGEAYADELWIPENSPGIKPCYRCPILCCHNGIIKNGEFEGLYFQGPEFETNWAFGPQCGVKSKEAIIKADFLCDYYGFDTISLGNTVGFLMECFERGLLSKDKTNNLDLRFGNSHALISLIELAGRAEGIGVLVGNGVKYSSERIGKNSADFSIHSKGLELPAYDPRAAQGMGLNYAIGDRGACHSHAYTVGLEMFQPPSLNPSATDGKAKIVKGLCEATNAFWDSTGVCKFLLNACNPDLIRILVNDATGLQIIDVESFKKIGERINNLTRCFNIREGFSRKDDTLPRRLLEEPLSFGSKQEVVHLDVMLDEYYNLCGWDQNGVPKRDKLLELDLEFAII